MRQPPCESFPSPGVTTPGQFGPIETRSLLPCIARLTRIMSRAGMPSVMQTTSSSPGIHAFQDGVGGKRGRNENGGGGRAGLFYRIGHGVKDGNFFAAMLEDLARLCRA